MATSPYSIEDLFRQSAAKSPSERTVQVNFVWTNTCCIVIPTYDKLIVWMTLVLMIDDKSSCFTDRDIKLDFMPKWERKTKHCSAAHSIRTETNSFSLVNLFHDI